MALCLVLFTGLTARAEDGIAIDEHSFPDAIFRQWVLNPANLNGIGADGVLTPEERESVTELLVYNQGIASLKGIELFPELTTLSCGNNRLTELDVSQNLRLVTLLCAENQLTELDVSHNTALRNLNCELNRLTRLDLTGCTELEWLYSRQNQLEQLDLSNNRELIFIETFDNHLTSIDVSNLTKLEFLHIDHNRLTELDLSHNVNLVNDGSGFVVRNNYIRRLILPDHPNLDVSMDVYAEQTPMAGYAETEWYLDPDFTQPIDGTVKATGQTLYAKWIPNPYTIRFDVNGGTGTIAPIATVYDAQVILPMEVPTRKGYTFQGWKGYVDGRNQIYAPGQTVSSLTGKWDYQTSITLTAQWEPYQAKLEANGGRFQDDGAETKVLPVSGGAQIRLPGSGELAREGMELLAWSASDQPAYTQDTPFYLPGTELTVKQGSDFYAQWYGSGRLVVYHGPEGAVRLQAAEGDSLNLYTAETFVQDGPPVRVWNTRADGSGDSYAPGSGLETAAWTEGITHLYALWAYPTRTELTLTQDTYAFNGHAVDLKAESAVTCLGVPVEGAQVEYVYYAASDPDTPLEQAPTAAGSYLVRAVYAGDAGLEQMESASAARSFTITQGQTGLTFDGVQTLRWTGEAAAIQPPALTMNGLPWEAEVSYSFHSGESGLWTDGLPSEAGTYQLRATLAGTENYTSATAETTLTICYFQREDGVVKGSMPVTLPDGTGTCRVTVALYDGENGQMLDLRQESYRRGEGTVILDELRLNPRGREQLLVKVFVTGEGLEGLSPVLGPYEV